MGVSQRVGKANQVPWTMDKDERERLNKSSTSIHVVLPKLKMPLAIYNIPITTVTR